ncbi:MAG: CCA tRNA nucleotidyltransferase [Sneathiella sp.]|nr:CCA tRNA nucleotidyltransferase [Sneathiella sp.]
MSATSELCDLVQTPPPWISYPETRRLFSEVEKADGKCRFVGGCVRDALLGNTSDDLDICTDLLPEKILETLEPAGIKVVPTGIKHGTVTAFMGKRKFEITTLRTDTKTYGRHADVSYTKNWETDAARRDFTINALSMDLSGELYDFFSGVEDLAAGRVRFIGEADDRIEEDRLRVLRFFRFFSRYGKGDPDKDALAACEKAASTLDILSAERVSKELFLLLEHPAPLKSLNLMKNTGILSALFNQKITLDLVTNMLALPVQTMPINRLGALLQGKIDWAVDFAQDLRLSAKAKERLVSMCEEIFSSELSKHEQKERLYRHGKQMFEDQVLMSWAGDPARLNYQKYLELADRWAIPQFPVLGRDLLDLGMKPGPDLGLQLKKLETQWIGSGFSLNKTQLLACFN